MEIYPARPGSSLALRWLLVGHRRRLAKVQNGDFIGGERLRQNFARSFRNVEGILGQRVAEHGDTSDEGVLVDIIDAVHPCVYPAYAAVGMTSDGLR